MTRSNPDHVIKSVHAVATGTGGLHKEHLRRSRWPQLFWLLASQSWIEVPIGAFLIEHRDGLVLFDTGMDPAICSDPGYIDSAIGRFLLRRIFRLSCTTDDGLGPRLEGIGFSPSTVKKAVISHLHFDHVGGIAQVPQAELLVSMREWQQLQEPHSERKWILREHIEIPGADWRPIEFAPTDDPLLAPFGGCFDVMADGSMMMLPTPGHSPGSASLLVRGEGLRPYLMIGDLAFEQDRLMQDQLPGLGDAEQLRASYAKVRALKRYLPDLVILPSHDPLSVRALAAHGHPATAAP